METLGEYLKKLRGKESLREASKRIGISHTYLDTIEKGYDKRSGKPVKPTPETLKLIADGYHVSYEDLMARAGYIEEIPDDNSTPLANKAEKDIAKRIQKFREEIENSDGLAFNGEPLSEEAKESLIESMEYIFRQTQKINKKYVPKKFRDEE
ncbi:helix-turn-helix domain-containing protein [Ureibacillus thermophilus]|uniref:XRE family transcriptional regulator n=1 Tax=Ureibacillus thermophilus TaxID=367743 RepID=A0A4P6UV51_9BACL|nr:helix-turn-helix transcriptional regulator [Ureibacillus thermophilus]QBK26707.1 XRE family transcriptional regulator [Ureibacillus thermophilus]